MHQTEQLESICLNTDYQIDLITVLNLYTLKFKRYKYQ